MKRTNLFWVAVFLLTLVCSANGYVSAAYWFDSVIITPPDPTEVDAITVDISCSTDIALGWGLLYLEHDPPLVDLIHNDIEINLWAILDGGVDFGFDLDETVLLNPLPGGDYTMIINLHTDEGVCTEITGFTVVPEPGTMLLLGLGGIWLRRRRL